MYNLSNLTIADMTLCSTNLRNMGNNAASIEEVAESIAQHFYENMLNGETREKAVALSRLFLVMNYKDLPAGLQSFAKSILGDKKEYSDMNCLTLLGTRGDKAEWNSRHASTGHKAVPLASVNFVRNIPMLSALISQFGLELEDVVDRNIIYTESRTFNVFYIKDALNNPLVPHQEDFVHPSKIRTVLGFGGVLPSGNLFVNILFTKITISKDIADLFRPLALSVKLALIPFEEKIFKQI